MKPSHSMQPTPCYLAEPQLPLPLQNRPRKIGPKPHLEWARPDGHDVDVGHARAPLCELSPAALVRDASPVLPIYPHRGSCKPPLWIPPNGTYSMSPPASPQASCCCPGSTVGRTLFGSRCGSGLSWSMMISAVKPTGVKGRSPTTGSLLDTGKGCSSTAGAA